MADKYFGFVAPLGCWDEGFVMIGVYAPILPLLLRVITAATRSALEEHESRLGDRQSSLSTSPTIPMSPSEESGEGCWGHAA
ncbi:hypothetical protein [Sinorhizobium meliloti]|uniref:hypothetical protein n=1 Tax=Rhizobium meliloti TaxID=382 RepID=UPI0013E2EE63|nr:hypothetical protein [Sinorhizobium meliloti]